MARVLISSDAPARVTRVLTLAGAVGVRSMRGNVEELLCETTPCAVTLPYGDHELRLVATGDPRRAGTLVAHVHESTVVINNTLPRHNDPNGHAAGVALVLVGLLTAGSAAAAAPRANTDAFVGGVAGVGVAAVLAGFVLMGAYPRTVQPGASREWSPSPASAPSSATSSGTVGLSLGGRF
jgi:hypothetical protein